MKQSAILLEQASNLLQRVIKFIFGIHFWLFYSFILIISGLQNGLWGGLQTYLLFLISEDIFKNTLATHPLDQWMYTSFLGPVLAYFTFFNQSVYTYIVLQFTIFFVFFPLLILALRHRHGDFSARTFLLFFFLSPLANILLTWLGTPDMLTILLLMLFIIFIDKPPVVFLAIFLLSINHFEQGAVVCISVIIFSWITGRNRIASIFALIALILGKISLDWYFVSHNFGVEYSRLDYVEDAGRYQYFRAFLSNPFALFFSFYNLFGIFLAAYLVYFGKKSRITIAFLVYNVMAFLVVLITLDQTRVFAMLTFPAVLLLLTSPQFQQLEESEKDFFKQVLAIIFILGLWMPRFVVWNGDVFYSSYVHLVEYANQTWPWLWNP